MAEGTYEYELERAELLGIDPPDRATFEAQQAKLREQMEQQENEELQKLEAEGETLNNTGGKLDELNSILTKTQHKLNSFKVRACSLTSLIKLKSGFSDSKEDLGTESTSNTQQPEPTDKNDINEALDALDEMKINEQSSTAGPVISDEAIRQAKIDREKKQSSNLDKLDSLITKAENAQYSMKHQSNQMKKFMQ